MPGFDGTGPSGMGPMTGGGRGFCSPWGIGRVYGFGSRWGPGRAYRFGMGVPYTGTVPYVYPNVYPRMSMGAVPGAYSYSPQMTREQELDFLRSQAEAIKGQLEQINARVKDLETE